MFSDRSHRDAERHPLHALREDLKSRGVDVFDLTESNPTRADIPYERENILRALSAPGSLVYEPAPFGIRSAREAIALEYASRGCERSGNAALDPEHMVLTASTSEAYTHVFRLLCDPGDDILVPAPSYPLFDELARAEGINLRPYPLRYDGAWHLSSDDLERARTERTRAVLVVHPNNPTGSYLKRAENEAIAAVGLPCIYDVVFETYPLGPNGAPSDAADVMNEGPRLRFVLSGLSKLAALPQVKLAWTWVRGEPTLVKTALDRLEHGLDATLSVASAVQHGAASLIACTRSTHDAILARAKTNLALAEKTLAGSAAAPLHVEGGWYVIVRLPETESEEAWALSLLAERSVYTHPGEFFGFGSGAHVVLSLLTPEPRFAEGLIRLAKHVAARN